MALEFFGRQFWALFVKNWIVFSKHPLYVPSPLYPPPFSSGNLDQFPSMLGFAGGSGNLPRGGPAVSNQALGCNLEWASQPLYALYSRNSKRLLDECPQNFNGFSGCYAGVVFSDIPRNNASAPITYTIMGQSGLNRIDVMHEKGDYERRVMPLQWAVDQVSQTLLVVRKKYVVCKQWFT
ncbi:hypothetical protein B0H14DRAFT_3726268 [Mycena olivaceomarginata]|nr:hypothetical protein B0H14DRAFT_3146226 [Mycena olivaceomarginata]KAJ7825555.1 hypothetical protein B0H14DRAFT_3726268 [Mycena olivaceomarginata]